MAFVDPLNSWAEAHNLDLDDSIKNSIMNGFGNVLDGEGRFDAFVGLYGMINVVLGNHPAGKLMLPHISKIEGWICGQEQPRKVNGVSRITS